MFLGFVQLLNTCSIPKLHSNSGCFNCSFIQRMEEFVWYKNVEDRVSQIRLYHSKSSTVLIPYILSWGNCFFFMLLGDTIDSFIGGQGIMCVLTTFYHSPLGFVPLKHSSVTRCWRIVTRSLFSWEVPLSITRMRGTLWVIVDNLTSQTPETGILCAFAPSILLHEQVRCIPPARRRQFRPTGVTASAASWTQPPSDCHSFYRDKTSYKHDKPGDRQPTRGQRTSRISMPFIHFENYWPVGASKWWAS